MTALRRRTCLDPKAFREQVASRETELTSTVRLEETGDGAKRLEVSQMLKIVHATKRGQKHQCLRGRERRAAEITHSAGSSFSASPFSTGRSMDAILPWSKKQTRVVQTDVRSTSFAAVALASAARATVRGGSAREHGVRLGLRRVRWNTSLMWTIVLKDGMCCTLGTMGMDL